MIMTGWWQWWKGSGESVAEEIYSTQAPSPNLDPNDPRPIDSFILLIHKFILYNYSKV